MRIDHAFLLTSSVFSAVALPICAYGQDAGSDLMAQNVSSLRGEIQSRYDEALTLTQDPGVVSANSSQFMWASQAKAQCGIALGFLKSSTKDPVSIGKCAEAYLRMQRQTVPPPPPPSAASCNMGPYVVFFEWNSAELTPEAATVIDSAIAANRDCQNRPINVAGYADRSGSDAYNQGLSVRRTNSVGNYLTSQGVDNSAITTQGFGEANPRVPTADGVRELQNRRVEITFN